LTQLVVALGFFWLVRHLGERWLWPTVAGGAAVSYLFIVLWPMLILPLFYRVSPVPAGELRQGIAELATRAGVEVQDVRFIDASRVSSHTNAFFVGIGGRRSIYLYDTLTEGHTVPEILAVVAHEIGHWRHRHVLKGWLLGVAGLTIGLLLLRWFLGLDAVGQVLRVRGPGDLAIIPLLWALSAGVGIVASPIESGVSRHFERQSDRASIELTGDPDTFIEMKQTLARKNRSNLLPHPAVVLWYASHPPVIDRILAAAAWRAPAPADEPPPAPTGAAEEPPDDSMPPDGA
jgi:STE24 endopeptidase